ncbi:hypothetical protein OIN59_09980 [Acidovorax sp. D2M1]|uniref:Peptidase C39 family protein n=1 Tax=Acidovorax benzenivorans TaxID=2987520 RepID=A0ABT5RVN6_9BURK|nr:hypothetical protein [Acidovorax benzenivorans]MDD2177764.1 hypothetical protein [Acidovorax benzenivorans]
MKTKRQEPVRFFMQQSDLDGACGVHIAAMILAIHDLAKPSALHEMSHRKSGISALVWQAFQHTYFAGVHPEEWVELMDGLNLPLALTAKYGVQDNADSHALEWLMRGGDLVALAFASVKHARTKHWALAVGVEGAAVGKVLSPDSMLLIDPSASEPSFSPFNARLRLPQTGPGRRAAPNWLKPSEEEKRKPVHWLYEAAEWNAEEVRLLAAIRVQLRLTA